MADPLSRPRTPSSPLTPRTETSRGSTCVGNNSNDVGEAEVPIAIEKEIAAGPSPTTTTQNTENVDFDPEAQTQLPRRATLTDSLKRAGTGLSNRLPVHWRPNYLAENRNAQRIDDHPMGYPRLGSFMNSDENFLLCRRYSLLHTRVMLYRQAELAQLERDLFELDKEDEEDRDRALKNVKFLKVGEKGEDRMDLIKKIDEKLKEYDDIVMRLRSMSALPKASTRNYASLDNWVHHSAPLSHEDQELFREDGDFAALVDPKEAVSLDGFIEDCLSMIPCRFTRLLFSTPEQRASTDDKLVHLYSKKRIDTFVRLLITCLAVALLIAPTVILFEATDSGAIMIIVILLFTLFFSIALSIFTKAARHEVFAATAAYCAVLVVFLGNLLVHPSHS